MNTTSIWIASTSDSMSVCRGAVCRGAVLTPHSPIRDDCNTNYTLILLIGLGLTSSYGPVNATATGSCTYMA